MSLANITLSEITSTSINASQTFPNTSLNDIDSNKQFDIKDFNDRYNILKNSINTHNTKLSNMQTDLNSVNQFTATSFNNNFTTIQNSINADRQRINTIKRLSWYYCDTDSNEQNKIITSMGDTLGLNSSQFEIGDYFLVYFKNLNKSAVYRNFLKFPDGTVIGAIRTIQCLWNDLGAYEREFAFGRGLYLCCVGEPTHGSGAVRDVRIFPLDSFARAFVPESPNEGDIRFDISNVPTINGEFWCYFPKVDNIKYTLGNSFWCNDRSSTNWVYAWVIDGQSYTMNSVNGKSIPEGLYKCKVSGENTNCVIYIS